MRLFVLATIASIAVVLVIKMICAALTIPDYWTGYASGVIAAAVAIAIVTKGNKHKAKCFDSYGQYQDWKRNAQKRGDIEIVAVTDFNGNVIVTYIIEE